MILTGLFNAHLIAYICAWNKTKNNYGKWGNN